MKKTITLLTMLLFCISVNFAQTSQPVKLPTQTGHAGEYLKTNGSKLSWSTVSAGLSGSLTAGYVPKAVSSSSLTNSSMLFNGSGRMVLNYADPLGTNFGHTVAGISGYSNIFNVGEIGLSNSYFSIESGGAFKLGNVASDKLLNFDNSAFWISQANFGIGTNSPTAKLHVLGLIEFTDNAAAISAGLTPGAFYRTGDLLKVVH